MIGVFYGEKVLMFPYGNIKVARSRTEKPGALLCQHHAKKTHRRGRPNSLNQQMAFLLAKSPGWKPRGNADMPN
jgi:hypothetical protein